eukprot:jgi/Psemu1/288639/fgenesh1_pg.279_\
MDLATVHLCHKYSDAYKHQKNFANIRSGQTTSERLTVEYNTGAFTTGRDWWYVAFTAPDGSFYQSNPQNGRKVLDGLEQVGFYATNVISGLSVFSACATGSTAVAVQRAGYDLIAKGYSAYGGAVGLAATIGLLAANT